MLNMENMKKIAKKMKDIDSKMVFFVFLFFTFH